MKAKISKTYIIFISLLTAVAAAVSISGCGNQPVASRRKRMLPRRAW